MANATARPTTADLLYARTAALELIEELHAAVKAHEKRDHPRKNARVSSLTYGR